jgi:hypothetical protein
MIRIFVTGGLEMTSADRTFICYDLVAGLNFDQSRNPSFVKIQTAAQAGSLDGIAGLEDFGLEPRSDRDTVQTRIGGAYDELNTASIQNPDDRFDNPAQMGPDVTTDARHRLNVSAVVRLPYDVQVAPALPPSFGTTDLSCRSAGRPSGRRPLRHSSEGLRRRQHRRSHGHLDDREHRTVRDRQLWPWLAPCCSPPVTRVTASGPNSEWARSAFASRSAPLVSGCIENRRPRIT